MKDWRMWAPIQTKKQREVADNLSSSEKEEAARLAKELGRKGAYFMLPVFLLLYFLFWHTSLTLKNIVVLSILVAVPNYIVFWKFVGLPYRKKQKTLLNNSKYAKENNITV